MKQFKNINVNGMLILLLSETKQMMSEPSSEHLL